MRFFLAFGLLICAAIVSGTTSAQSPVYSSSRATAYTTYTAQGVAERMAADGQCRHYGNPTGGYEGVGYSPSSPEAAKRNCCFWGRRPVRDIGVARGSRGWYACVRYH